MKLWLLAQDKVKGYDTFDSCVVVADTEEIAKDMHPSYDGFALLSERSWPPGDWAPSAADVTAICLGWADDETRRVVCASFNAG